MVNEYDNRICIKNFCLFEFLEIKIIFIKFCVKFRVIMLE